MESKYINSAKDIIEEIQHTTGVSKEKQVTYPYNTILKVAKQLKALDKKYSIDFSNNEKLCSVVALGHNAEIISIIGENGFNSKEYQKLNEMLDDFTSLILD